MLGTEPRQAGPVSPDEALCTAITDETGAAATSATLAQLRAFEALGTRRFSLAVPYLDDVRLAIVENFTTAGIPVRRRAG